MIRARLRPDRALATLGPLLTPAAPGGRVAASHRLVWSLFADAPEAARDFLFREEAAGRFLILSKRLCVEDHPFLSVEQKPFEPSLRKGDRLSFMLRANPTVAVRKPPAPGELRQRGKPQDAIWHTLREVPPGEARRAARPSVVRQAGLAWLARQGTAHGFAPEAEGTTVVSHDVLDLPRERGGRAARLAVVDYAGALTVTDPHQFVPALARGFGRAKAFGCGLMLIRRAPFRA